jgi:predicted Rossmann fold nucleotide-binding protein DprA/Smf involved in DNA uptake
VIISGGCRGVDTWAELEAKSIGLETEIFRPALDGCNSYRAACAAYSDRNRLIAEACDMLVAFVAPDRKGGTEQTIRFATALGKPVTIL